jgi:hypothetical protein
MEHTSFESFLSAEETTRLVMHGERRGMIAGDFRERDGSALDSEFNRVR